jgi:putative transposase
MNKPIDSVALFRLAVLGPLASRGELLHGELKTLTRELAAKAYNIPGTQRTHLSAQTIQRWYYDWQRQGIEGLNPEVRKDKGQSHLKPEVQAALIAAKEDNPARSMDTLIGLLRSQGVVAKDELSRATVHRFLKQHALSKRLLPSKDLIERRAFVAERAGQLWQGDVLHGPSIQTPKGLRKTYLVSLLDDASRLIAHSAFCLGETALDVEGVLKQALLKRGVPYKLILDNGSAYRSRSLQTICASLEIRLVYCRPYEPQGKGKIERYHNTFRSQFLSELNLDSIANLDDLNARLWAWIEQVYHQRPHGGLSDNMTPFARWSEDLVHIRPLGLRATTLDDLFYYRHKRTVRQDGTVHFEGTIYEVPYTLAKSKVLLVVDPHTQKAIKVESLNGDYLGAVTLLDRITNNARTRQRGQTASFKKRSPVHSTVDLAYEAYQKNHTLFNQKDHDHV